MENILQHIKKSKPAFYLGRHPVFQFTMQVAKRMSAPYYAGIAGELGFFFLFSIVPLLFLFTEILGIFSISLDALTELLHQYALPEFAEILLPHFHFQSAGAIIIVTLFALWAASKVQFALIRISNYSYGHQSPGIKGFLMTRLRAVVTILILLVVIAFMLVILVYGESIVDLIELYLNQYLHIDFELERFWFLLRWPFSVALIFVGVVYNYGVITPGRVSFAKVVPGSLFAAVAMVLASAVYSWYVSVYANYDLIYGSLAAIISLLFWFYILGYILVLGIQINILWEEKPANKRKISRR